MRLRTVALSGVLGAVLLVSQIALAPLPNIEVVSLLVMLFTLTLGKYVGYTLAVFVLLEGLVYGFGLWWFSYLYIWALLAAVTFFLRKMDSRLGWALVNGFFGMAFGALTAIPTVVISGFAAGGAYIISGIPFDIIHAISNFMVAFLLMPTLKRLLLRLTHTMHIGTRT